MNITKKITSNIFSDIIEMNIQKDKSVSNVLFDYYEIISTKLSEMLDKQYILKMYVYSKEEFENCGDYYPINTKIKDISCECLYIYIIFIKNQ